MHHVGHVDWDFSEPPAGYAGSAAGYSSSCLVGSHTGAVHTDLSISKLEPGGWTGLHLHSFESAVYVLAGTPVLNIDGHQNQLRTGDYALLPIGMPHGWANPSGGQARLLVHSTPQRRPAGQRPRSAAISVTTRARRRSRRRCAWTTGCGTGNRPAWTPPCSPTAGSRSR